MISLILPTQGNPIALKRTIDSVEGICDEVIVGDVCVFEDDKKAIDLLGVKRIELPFNYIFKNGFADTLNTIASHAKNDLVLYLNVGEVISEGKDEILSKLDSQYNAYYIDHASEQHRWFRFYNKYEMVWSGIIHEELQGDYKPYHKPIFRFADTDKDTVNSFKAKVMNMVKECVYWQQLIQIADNPDNYPETNDGWKQFASDTYQSMKDRLVLKGEGYQAFLEGDKDKFLNYIHTDKEFEAERFKSTSAIEFQGDKIHLI